MSNNHESIVSHSLNVSSSKQAFSFPRSNRFFSNRHSSNDKMYIVPSTLNKKTCTFGFGNKTTFQLKQSSPPPGTYKSISEFTKEKRLNTISFGSGREQVKFGSFLVEAQKKKTLPPPNSYNIKNSFSKKYGKMAIRLPTDIDLLTKKKNPGPGTYNLDSIQIKNSGSYILDKFRYVLLESRNNLSPKFHSPSSSPKRQSPEKKIGPGQYDLTKLNVLSKFKSSHTGKFSKALRSGMEDKSKIYLPGFKYRRFSQFSGSDQ